MSKSLIIMVCSLFVLQCFADLELIQIPSEATKLIPRQEDDILINNLENTYPLNWPWRGINVEGGPEVKLKVNVQTIKELRISGINSIRLVVQAKRYSVLNNLPIEVGINQLFNYCEEIIQWCAKEGIVVIISSTDFPLDPLKKFLESSPEFWGSEVERNAALSYINKLVLRFDKYENVVAYDFFSEPLVVVNDKFEMPENWFNYFEKVINTIRNHSTKHIIFTPAMGGLPRGYSSFTEPYEDDKIIYSIHYFNPHSYTHQGIGDWTESHNYPEFVDSEYWDQNTIRNDIKIVANWAKENNKLVFVGEFSVVRWAESKEKYLEDVLSVFEENKMGYSYWVFDGFPGWNIDLEPVEKKSNELIKAPQKTLTRQILENFWKLNN